MSHGLHNTHDTDRPWTLDPRRQGLTYLSVPKAKPQTTFHDDLRVQEEKRCKEHKATESRAMTRASSFARADALKVAGVTAATLLIMARGRA
jgi:hypothetical protein